jgi:citrate lyase beta subunit
MLIISQNASNYDIPIPNNAVYRINLAWVNSIEELEKLLKKHEEQQIFLDLPKGRIKPPNNKYVLEDLFAILNTYTNIKYFAVSNVNSAEDLSIYTKVIPQKIIIVPKIESPKAVLNIKNIVDAIPTTEKFLMLDHDDLFSNLIKNNEPTTKFTEYITNLAEFCNTNNISLLRTIGVIFSDEEKRTTQYIK